MIEKPEGRLELQIIDTPEAVGRRTFHRKLYLWIEADVAAFHGTESIRKRALSLSLYNEEIGRSCYVWKGESNMKKRSFDIGILP